MVVRKVEKYRLKFTSPKPYPVKNMSSITRSGYKVIANALRASDPAKLPGFDLSSVQGRMEFRQWKRSCFSLADELAKDSASFNRSLFFADCGLTQLRLVPGYGS